MADTARWRRRKEARPQEILEAALDLFVTKGFAAARMDAVAERAGVSKGTLYLYFPSKDALFRAVVRENLLPNIARAEALIAAHPGPADAMLRALIERMIEVLSDSRLSAIPKMVLTEIGAFPDLARFYLTEVIQRGRRLVQGIIERGIAEGRFRPVPSLAAAKLVLAPMVFAALWRHSFAPYDPEGPAPTEIATLHLDFILRSLTQPRRGEAP